MLDYIFNDSTKLGWFLKASFGFQSESKYFYDLNHIVTVIILTKSWT